MKPHRSTASKGEAGGDRASAVPASATLSVPPGEFAIRTYLKNTYLTARDGGRHSIDAVITAATAPGPNEKFRLSKIAPTNYTTIQTLQGYYVSAAGGGGLGGNVEASRFFRRKGRSSQTMRYLGLIGPSAVRGGN